MKLKLVRLTATNGLHIHVLGHKNFWKNLFAFNTLILDDPYFVDFVWNEYGQVDKVYLNTMKILHSEDQCVVNKNHILFSTTPNPELMDIYNSMKETVKRNNRNLDDLL